MPLVRVALRRGPEPGLGKQVGEIVYRAMTETINVPEQDENGLVYDPSYLGIDAATAS
jgi:hypothetical protein